MRRFLKQLKAGVQNYSGYLRFTEKVQRDLLRRTQVKFLMYHRVIPDPLDSVEYTQPGIAVSCDTFERQIAYLARTHNVIPLKSLLQHLEGDEPLPERAVVITFDDGWRDNFDHAYPILQKYGTPCVIFVCAGFVGTRKKFWFHEIWHSILDAEISLNDLNLILSDSNQKMGTQTVEPIPASAAISKNHLVNEFLERIKHLEPSLVEGIVSSLRGKQVAPLNEWDEARFLLSWEELKAMNPGIVSIGSHGSSHRLLTRISAEELLDECTESKRILENRLERSIEVIAYPNGANNETVRNLCKQAGYKIGFTVGQPRGAPNRFRIGRIGIQEGTTDGFGGRFSESVFEAILNRSAMTID